MPKSLGRYLKTTELLELESLPVSDYGYCVIDIDLTTPAPSEVIVLSHRWQSPAEPDPSGLTFEIVMAHLRQLGSIDGEFWPLDENIGREEASRLLELRRSVPIFTASYFNEADDLKSSLEKGSVSGMAVLNWIRESVDAVVEAHWWIDSYALPHPLHRRSCEHCTREYPLLLQRLPDTIASSTCFSVARGRDVERGWILLETCIASTAKRLIKHHVVEWNAFDLRHRMALGHYTCTEAQDAWYIPRAYALHRVVETTKVRLSVVESEPDGVALLDTVRQQIAPLLGLGTSSPEVDSKPIDAIQRVLEHAISDEFTSIVHQFEPSPPYLRGRFIMDVVANCAMAILVSNCVRQGRRLRLDANPLDAAAAATIQALCVEDQSEMFDAALAISELWALYCLEVGEGSPSSERRRALTRHFCRHLAAGHRFVIAPEAFGVLTSPGHRLHDPTWRFTEWAIAGRRLDKCRHLDLQYYVNEGGDERSCEALGS
jgi:hypothetical protein